MKTEMIFKGAFTTFTQAAKLRSKKIQIQRIFNFIATFILILFYTILKSRSVEINNNIANKTWTLILHAFLKTFYWHARPQI